MDTNKITSRYQHLDIARGIGIILVVMAHNSILRSLETFILPFHMPLFFFISGVLIKESDSLKDTFYKKCNSLLLPYFFTISIVVILKFYFQTNNADISILINNLVAALYSTGKTLAWPHLWFLTSLFITIVFLKISQIYIFNRIKKIYIKLLILILFINVGYSVINGEFYVPIYRNLLNKYGGLPWSIDLIAVTFFYAYLGFILKHLIISDIDNFIFNKYSTFIYLLIYSVLLIPNDHIDLNLRKLNYITIDTIMALLGIFFTIGLSKYIASSSHTKFKKCLSELGKLSLIIYIFHYYIQYKAIEMLTSYSLFSMYASAIISLIIGLLCPIIIYFLLIKKFALLRMVYSSS